MSEKKAGILRQLRTSCCNSASRHQQLHLFKFKHLPYPQRKNQRNSAAHVERRHAQNTFRSPFTYARVSTTAARKALLDDRRQFSDLVDERVSKWLSKFQNPTSHR